MNASRKKVDPNKKPPVSRRGHFLCIWVNFRVNKYGKQLTIFNVLLSETVKFFFRKSYMRTEKKKNLSYSQILQLVEVTGFELWGKTSKSLVFIRILRGGVNF